MKERVYIDKSILENEINRIDKIVDAIDMGSPVTASCLLVAACIAGKQVLAKMTKLEFDYNVYLLSWGYDIDCSLECTIKDVSKKVQSLMDDIEPYYDAFVLKNDIYGLELANIDAVNKDIAESQDKIAKMLSSDNKVIRSLNEWAEKSHPNMCFPMDVTSYHESVYGMALLLDDIIELCVDKARKIDFSVKHPSCEMIKNYLIDSFDWYDEMVWPHSQIKSKFDYERMECLQDEIEGTRTYKEKDLLFLKSKRKELDNNYVDSVLWQTFRLNYNKNLYKFNLDKISSTIKNRWHESAGEKKVLTKLIEPLLLFSYILSEIKRLTEELNGNTPTTSVEPLKDNVKKVSQKGGRGRKAGSLFNSPATQMEYVNLFVDFLKKSKKSSVVVDSSMDNYVNKAFVALYRICLKKNLVDKSVNGRACYRFLVDDCKCKVSSGVKTYGTFIKQYAEKVISRDNAARKYIEYISLIETNMEEFMKNK